MIELNLLPTEEKIASKLMWRYVILKNIILIILSLSFVIMSVLFGAKIILLKKFAEVEQQSKVVNITHQTINEKVNSHNKQIRIIDTIQQEYIDWPDLLYNFNESLLDSISYNYLDINYNENKIQVNGLAAVRQDLLDLKEKLENCGMVENISLPLNTLLKKNDIQFSIEADLINSSCTDEQKS